MPEAAPTSNALTLADLKVCADGEPRIEDVVLAKALGFSRATDIRRTIKANAAELRYYGEFTQVCVNLPGASKGLKKGKGGRPSQAYLLNEQQAVLVSMFARTVKGAEVRRSIVMVFTAWLRGRQTAASEKLATARKALDDGERKAFRHKPRTRRLAPQITAMLDDGRSYRDIAREFGMSKNTVMLVAQKRIDNQTRYWKLKLAESCAMLERLGVDVLAIDFCRVVEFGRTFLNPRTA